MLKIIGTSKKSLAKKLRVPNGQIVAFNGEVAVDMLDVAYYESAEEFTMTVLDEKNIEHTYNIKKELDESLGLIFDDASYLSPKRCKNKCIFCFVDQLPKNMRNTLYIKDDDWQMSFACGNYVTLTNLSESDMDRIINKKFSPLYVSVHATENDLRRKMLGNKIAGEIMPMLKKFADNGIIMNTQIVLCPNVNDNEHLSKSLTDLYSLYPQVKSVAVVPVGLTKHRENLPQLTTFDEINARKVVELVENFDKKVFEKENEHFVYCSDELYVDANLPIPPSEYYGDYDQIENGVGLLASLKEDFDFALECANAVTKNSYTIITGVSAEPYLSELIDKAKAKFPALDINIYAIRNDFFGQTVTVAGLVTGNDIIKQVSDKKINDVVLLPSVMLKEFEDVFLDGVTLTELEKTLNRKIVKISDGYALCSTILKGDYV